MKVSIALVRFLPSSFRYINRGTQAADSSESNAWLVLYARAAAALEIQPCISQQGSGRGSRVQPCAPNTKPRLPGSVCGQISQAEAKGFLLISISEITKPSVDPPYVCLYCTPPFIAATGRATPTQRALLHQTPIEDTLRYGPEYNTPWGPGKSQGTCTKSPAQLTACWPLRTALFHKVKHPEVNGYAQSHVDTWQSLCSLQPHRTR